jgi:signal transduction histidine kinase/DNA-binding response OmpR family regulator/ligand-binding sensor domain-containing protein
MKKRFLTLPLRDFRMVTLVVVLSLILFRTGYPQSQYYFKHFDNRNGLFKVYQDSLGFIWLQSTEGLWRFDGYNFKSYRYSPSDSSQKALNFDNGGLLLDEGNNLWVLEHLLDLSTPRSTAKYDWKKDKFVRYEIDLKGAYAFNKILPEKDGSLIWLIGRRGRGLISYNTITRSTAFHLNPHADSLTNIAQNSVVDILKLDDSVLLSTDNGIWLFDPNTSKFRRPSCPPQDTLFLYHAPDQVLLVEFSKPRTYPPFWIRSGRTLVKVDHSLRILRRLTLPEEIDPSSWNWTAWNWAWENEDVLWYTGQGGKKIYRYDTRTSAISNIELGLDVRIDDFNIDREGNIWLVTERGITRITRHSLHFHNQELPELEASIVFDVKDSQFLVAAQSVNVQDFARVGAHKIALVAPIIPGATGNLQFQTYPTQIMSGQVVSFWKGKNFLWSAVEGDGMVAGFPIDPATGNITWSQSVLLRNDPKSPHTIASNMVSSIWEDEKESLWLTHVTVGVSKVVSHTRYGNKESVIRYTESPNELNTIGGGRPHKIFPNGSNSAWITSGKGGVFRVDSASDPKSKPIHVFSQDYAIGMSFRSRDGTLYFGSQHGLYRTTYDGREYAITKILSTSFTISGIQEDSFGRLWLSGSSGLVCYDIRKDFAIQFNETDGVMHSLSFSVNSLHNSRGGRMILVDWKGLTMFYPDSLQIDMRSTSPALTGLKVNNKEPLVGNSSGNNDRYFMPTQIAATEELTIDYLHNNFSLEFSAMEMIAPEKNLYRHKLQGYDPDWIETDYKNRTATYTNLPAGEYTFRVKASNYHGVWSDNERILKIVILPPPWKTAWAYAAYGVLFLGALFAARKNIVQRERLKSNLKVAQVEQEKEHMELEKAKEVDRVKTSFFTNISHEFRTPLTLISGPVEELLNKYSNDPKTSERLKLVQRNSELLLKLINQLLDLSRLEAGTLKIEKSNTDLFGFIRIVSGSFESMAQQKAVNLDLDIPAENRPVSVDKDKLETIVINLVNNAIKFTPAGGTVTVSCELNGDQLAFKVVDTGIGIPEDKQGRIFERFYQVSETHKEVGTGIGLALVKELVTLLGGKIQVKSTAGEGTSFSVQLPVESIADEAPLSIVSPSYGTTKPQNNGISNIEHRTANVEVNSAKATVLVVEDNADLRHFIIDCLGEEFDFLQAENGRKGMETAMKIVPDLIISDVMMPEMDGVTMTGKLKADVRTSHIPLILLTAKSTEDSKLHGLSSGADDYLTKPFNKNELLLKVRNGITRQQKLREKLRADLISTAPKVRVLSADEQFLDKVKGCIVARLSDEQLSVESLAEEIGLSRVQLYRKITALTGLSVNELIRKLRLQRASQLLEQKWGPVSQVAYEVGFSNLSYFSKVFKEEFGVLPSEYSYQGR